jgi:TATA-binding protein-associated factor
VSRLAQSFHLYDVIIVSYEVLRNDIEFFKPHDFNYCVLDEGHIIKNTKTKITTAVKSIQANHRLILSGTPIQNNVLELWSLFDFLMPGFLGTEKQFSERYSKPILAMRGSAKGKEVASSKAQEAGTLALEALHRQVLPFLLRRVKEDVLKDLPPKIIQDYYCSLSSLQKKLYEEFSRSQLSTIGSTLATGSGDKQNAQHVFQSLQYLRKLCNHPMLVLEPQKEEHVALLKELQEDTKNARGLSHAPKLGALK